jgi:hypothetical protein
MLGVGVGFDTKGAHKFEVSQPLSDLKTKFVVPDSRKGWVDSVQMLFQSYLKVGQPEIEFDYT